jgi:ribosomal protein L16 Arg81 hydroxylase
VEAVEAILDARSHAFQLMLTLHLADFSLEHFMANYWQQKPVVLRQVLRIFMT